jgi:hypothetical protein
MGLLMQKKWMAMIQGTLTYYFFGCGHYKLLFEKEDKDHVSRMDHISWDQEGCISTIACQISIINLSFPLRRLSGFI